MGRLKAYGWPSKEFPGAIHGEGTDMILYRENELIQKNSQ